MKETQKDKALSDLPDGQGEAVMRLVNGLTCLICDELDKYDVRSGVGIGITSIALAKMIGVASAKSNIGLNELKLSLVDMADNITKNAIEFYVIESKEMSDGR